MKYIHPQLLLITLQPELIYDSYKLENTILKLKKYIFGQPYTRLKHFENNFFLVLAAYVNQLNIFLNIGSKIN